VERADEGPRRNIVRGDYEATLERWAGALVHSSGKDRQFPRVDPIITAIVKR
jgi:hypothetical protein